MNCRWSPFNFYINLIVIGDLTVGCRVIARWKHKTRVLRKIVAITWRGILKVVCPASSVGLIALSWRLSNLLERRSDYEKWFEIVNHGFYAVHWNLGPTTLKVKGHVVGIFVLGIDNRVHSQGWPRRWQGWMNSTHISLFDLVLVQFTIEGVSWRHA